MHVTHGSRDNSEGPAEDSHIRASALPGFFKSPTRMPKQAYQSYSLLDQLPSIQHPDKASALTSKRSQGALQYLGH